MELYNNESVLERAFLVGVDDRSYDTEASINELEELAKTAGAEVFGKVTQKRNTPDNATFVGSGMLEQIKDLCNENEIDLLIFDSELSPSQKRNIEKATDIRVIDRTTLILDIFAANARTSEGKLQVELAQLKYSLPRLGGKGLSLSRLGGGIGTRGPGESKLESDRRHIRRRIHSLEQSLEALEKRRKMFRERRQKDGIVTVAIVGYTNAGKSTLLNALTDAGVLVEDKLFATLDPTSRAIKLPDGRSVMLIDTVGFIARLPHKLVEAFKSTLEEVVGADLILNICDASSLESEEHIKVTLDVLRELGAGNTPVITVFNKCDISENMFMLNENSNSVKISALKGIGLDELLKKIAKSLPPTRKRVKMLLPFSQGSLASLIRKDSVIKAEEYMEDGLFFDAIIDITLIERIQPYIMSIEQ